MTAATPDPGRPSDPTVPLDRSRPPAPGPRPHFDFPPVTRSSLANGLSLQVCRLSRLPLVSVTLFMRVGELDMARERAGWAVLAGAALDGGSGRRSGADMAEAFERIGAAVSINVSWEGTAAHLQCSADRLDTALPLLAEMIREPAFPRREVERVRDQQLAGIRHMRRDPSGMATMEANRRYFVPGHPFARPRSGTPESVEGVSPVRLSELTEARYRPANAGLIVVGDVEPAAVEQLATNRLGNWHGSPPPREAHRSGPASRERRLWVVNRPGSVQSVLRVGHVGASVKTDDHFALLVGNLILGGMFSSRLNLSLRERHGFTYGARSGFSFRSLPGPFQVSTSVGTEVTAPAVGVIVSELERLVEEGASAAEAEAARDFAIGAFGLRLETAGQVASRLSYAFVHGLPRDHFPRYRERVSKVTSEEISEALRRRVRPTECQIVVVGDAEKLEPSLEALGIGEVTVVEPDEG